MNRPWSSHDDTSWHTPRIEHPFDRRGIDLVIRKCSRSDSTITTLVLRSFASETTLREEYDKSRWWRQTVSTSHFPSHSTLVVVPYLKVWVRHLNATVLDWIWIIGHLPFIDGPKVPRDVRRFIKDVIKISITLLTKTTQVSLFSGAGYAKDNSLCFEHPKWNFIPRILTV